MLPTTCAVIFYQSHVTSPSYESRERGPLYASATAAATAARTPAKAGDTAPAPATMTVWVTVGAPTEREALATPTPVTPVEGRDTPLGPELFGRPRPLLLGRAELTGGAGGDTELLGSSRGSETSELEGTGSLAVATPEKGTLRVPPGPAWVRLPLV